ncbi:hypothetical protein Bhyg_06024 [Pseudolycoriella hygida]|uniref:Uncharacterized protein n=1 Tax=Pseudolycoriella hygida TaxID=35572 RepID=A0A9Q0N016_9DIPT|nr:hypothetical protein Bhyg_06024 [Pseudolycoriella hygida]
MTEKLYLLIIAVCCVQVELFVLFLTMGNNNLSKDEWKILLTTEDEGPDDESDEFGLGRLENELKKKASAEETEKIMKIIRKFKDDSAPEQQKQAVLDLIMYGIAGLIQRSVNKV